MDKQVKILLSLLLLGLFIAIVFGQINQTSSLARNNTNQSSVTVSEKVYDFGTISMAQGKVSYVFQISNPTQSEVNIKGLTTSCMCTVAYIGSGSLKKGPFGMPGMGSVPLANEIIKPGETKDVEVVYDPNAHGPAGVGSIDRFVYLTEEGGGTLQLEIKAMVTP